MGQELRSGWLVLAWGTVAETVGTWYSWELTGYRSSRSLFLHLFSHVHCVRLPHSMGTSGQLAGRHGDSRLRVWLLSSKAKTKLSVWPRLRSLAASLPLYSIFFESVTKAQPVSKTADIDFTFQRIELHYKKNMRVRRYYLGHL